MLQTPSAATFNVKIGGREFTASPLTFKDIDEFILWARQREMDKVVGAITDDMPGPMVTKIIRAGMKEAEEITESSTRFADILSSGSGLLRLFWLSLRRNHPKVTIDDLASIRFTAKDITTLSEYIYEANFSDNERR